MSTKGIAFVSGMGILGITSALLTVVTISATASASYSASHSESLRSSQITTGRMVQELQSYQPPRRGVPGRREGGGSR